MVGNRSRGLAGLLLLAGCVAQRNAIVLGPDPGAVEPLPFAAHVQSPPGSSDCLQDLADLEAAGLFRDVTCDSRPSEPHLDVRVALAGPVDETRRSAKGGEFLLWAVTLGLFPFEWCEPDHVFTFTGASPGEVSQVVHPEGCFLVGWVAPFYNARSDWYWPVPNKGRAARAETVRIQLAPLRPRLVELGATPAS
jgi:hypothetical protein